MICAFCINVSAATGSSRERDATYEKLKKSFYEQDWDNVLSGVDRFRTSFPHSNRESSITFMAAQAALYLRNLDRALFEAQYLWIRFPESRYRDDARMIKAECAILSERWEDAKKELDWLIGFALDDSLVSAAHSRRGEIEEFFAFKNAKNIPKQVIPSDQPHAVLLLPLSGESSENAEAFLTGFRYEWGQSFSSEPLVYDTRSDPVYAACLVRKLAEDGDVWVVTGGLDASEAAAIAATAELHNLPFISTMCGSDGLASIGNHIFQGRSDFSLIGTLLAKHAILEKGLGHFGIMAPQNLKGRQLASAFKQTVLDAGGSILVEEVYYSGTEDFRSYFNRIREFGLKYAFEDSLRVLYANTGILGSDSTGIVPGEYDLEADTVHTTPWDAFETEPVWTLTQEFMDSLWTVEHEHLREILAETHEEIDSLEIPISVFDGFLLVAEPGMLEFIAPQFARANIQTQLFGGEEWSDRIHLRRVKNYIEGLIFADPLSPSGGEEYYAFLTRIEHDADDPLHRYVLAGERAARMVEFGLDRSYGRESMRKALSQIRDLETFSGKVSLLKEERVDRHVQLFHVKKGEFQPIE